ncbi:hypothetical protein CL621_00940 [archaeon]|nr:hypothetical protein [archaeon]
MKYYLIYLIMFTSLFSQSAGESCNIELLSIFNDFDNQGVSDLTGFELDGKEFAVVGLTEGVSFIDITVPTQPVEIEYIEGTFSEWRDIKYWNKYVYIGTEAADGIKIVSVEDPYTPILVHTITAITNSHNIHIDADGYLYVVGANDHDIWIYDLSTPELPELIGTWEGGYLHDIEVYNNKVYGAGIYTGYFYIIDVSNKTNPETIGIWDSGGGYISLHDVAVTADEKYLITADENIGGHVKIWDISNYNNINLLSEYQTFEGIYTSFVQSAHNVYVKDGFVVISYYTAGTRVLDISDPFNPIEIGYYDTTNLEAPFSGNWGVYTELPSGYLISSDRENGLFVFNSPFSDSTMQWFDCNSDYYSQNDIDILQNFVDSFEELQGQDPVSIGDQVWFNGRLIELKLYEEGLTGQIPESIGNLTELKTLNLGNNNIGGKIPENIGNLSNLNSIILSKNNLIGNIPNSIFILPELNYLFLHDNNLGEIFSDSICILIDNEITIGLTENNFCYPYPSCISDHIITWQDCLLSVENNYSINPLTYSLGAPYPNPFNNSVTIKYNVPMYSNIFLKVRDISGKQIKTLFDGSPLPGAYNVTWNAEKVSSGIYFISLIKDNTIVETKIVTLSK